MTTERWSEIKEMLKDKFEVKFEGTELLDEPFKGEKEIIEFMSPMGRMRLEFTTQPVLLDKKTIGSRRIGSEATVEYIYSEDEFTHKFAAFRYDEANDDWIEMDMPKGDFSF